MIALSVDSASRPADGEQVCGDAFVLVRTPARVTLCVADGLGHGPLARDAADRACAFVAANPTLPADALMRGMARALAGSRGAAVAVLTVDAAGLASFTGVGNVELRALTQVPWAPVSVPGIVGRGTPRVLTFGHALAVGDLLFVHTDGISTRVELDALRSLPARDAAVALLAAGRKPHDDALCVAARYGEESA